MTREEQQAKMQRVSELAAEVFQALTKWAEEGSCMNEADQELGRRFQAYKDFIEETLREAT